MRTTALGSSRRPQRFRAADAGLEGFGMFDSGGSTTASGSLLDDVLVERLSNPMANLAQSPGRSHGRTKRCLGRRGHFDPV